MAEYSKEWCELSNIGMAYDFSIAEIFQRLRKGESVEVICEGFGITKVLNHENECHVARNGKIESFKYCLNKKK